MNVDSLASLSEVSWVQKPGARNEPYLLAHWRGELSLTKSMLLNGVIAYFVLVYALVGGGGQFIKSQAFVYYGGVVFIFFLI